MIKTGNEVTMTLYEESTKMKDKIKETGVVDVVGDSVSQGISATGDAIASGIQRTSSFIDENQTI